VAHSVNMTRQADRIKYPERGRPGLRVPRIDRGDIDANRDARTSCRVWAWSTGIGLMLLTAWAFAGYFMQGEDQVDHVVPILVVLSGGPGLERVDLACKLFSEGHGRGGVVLTEDNSRRFGAQQHELSRCGVPTVLIRQWLGPRNTFEELSAVAHMLWTSSGTQVIVISDSLHMARLRYLRDRLGLNGRVYFRQSYLDGRADAAAYLRTLVSFWFRESLAYVYYRLRY
jgi:hypothetical protein